MSKKEPDLTDFSDDALIERAEELARTAEKLRAKDAEGADRAAGAAQALREHALRRALARTEADNYARSQQQPSAIQPEE